MDMRFDGVNYFASDARLHYGSVSIKDGYIDRVDMADAAPHEWGVGLLLPGCIDTHTHAMLQSEYFAEDEAASAAAWGACASSTTAFAQPRWQWMKRLP